MMNRVALLRFIQIQESNGKRAYSCSADSAAKPVMAVQTEINSAGNARQAHGQSGNNAKNALAENHRIDSGLLTAPGSRLKLSLLKNPINPIGPNLMKPLNTGNWQQRRIRMVVLNNHLLTALALNVSGCLSAAHASKTCEDHGQRRQSHRANALHLTQNHDDSTDSRAETANLSSRPPHRSEDFSENVPCAHFAPQQAGLSISIP